MRKKPLRVTRKNESEPACRCVGILLLIPIIAFLPGCGDAAASREAIAARKQFVLTAQPPDEMAVSKVRKALSEGEGPEEIEVVLRGRIHAGEMPPWERGKAAFVLTDATGHEGEDDHDPHTCPFCSRHIRDYVANIMFSDETGLIEIDSRDLFGVQEKQLVYIRGTASIDEDDMLQIDANGIYVVPR